MHTLIPYIWVAVGSFGCFDYFLRNICTWTMAIGQKYEEKVMTLRQCTSDAFAMIKHTMRISMPTFARWSKDIEGCYFSLRKMITRMLLNIFNYKDLKGIIFQLNIWIFREYRDFSSTFCIFIKEKLNCFEKRRANSQFIVFFTFFFLSFVFPFSISLDTPLLIHFNCISVFE